jgi:hypothetical protein
MFPKLAKDPELEIVYQNFISYLKDNMEVSDYEPTDVPSV